jgi:hypothetical protein
VPEVEMGMGMEVEMGEEKKWDSGNRLGSLVG